MTTTSTASSIDNIERCDHCGKEAAHGVVLVEMKPGHDGKKWWLCFRDYVDGLKPMQLGNIPAEYKVDLPVKGKRKKAS